MTPKLDKSSKKIKYMKTWSCDICYIIFDTKRELCEDLANHFEDATNDADMAQSQLYYLGVKDHTKYL